ncbi:MULTISPECIES: DUF3783 domain-containing protein [unclassified Breznakia]|uniref:DUF3783 domain-containing protein n=1 Tax=unclassified Breznakia TaxID=2623764 RepID=UPI0024732A4F|nr:MULTISPECIES: DUF3783 domain-containing protein [unclassified Breznakia]MDH6366815.1 hypothetical protein [Breznakia sp. PH1-1]MDH6403993.1 hypothetical protein [Breznakia sp. PF1-11]MDH6411785.1 hypothetical protein [Breznakia sp. PFB1-11]MDH6413981.1 hypothetical protein [Breznakia sp. PFB1-14]MDH6416411.1 hypothetical protein [Breznakia sp. PFB1-4]
MLGTILLYTNKNREKEAKIIDALKEDFDILVLDPENLHETVGYLFGYEGYEANPKEDIGPFAHEVIVFSVVDPSIISEVAKILKEHEVMIDRKAMLTEHNQKWKVIDLFVELDEEHHYFLKRNRLNMLLQLAMKVKPDTVPEDVRPVFQKAVVEAYDVLKKQSSTDEIDQAIASLLPYFSGNEAL